MGNLVHLKAIPAKDFALYKRYVFLQPYDYYTWVQRTANSTAENTGSSVQETDADRQIIGSRLLRLLFKMLRSYLSVRVRGLTRYKKLIEVQEANRKQKNLTPRYVDVTVLRAKSLSAWFTCGFRPVYDVYVVRLVRTIPEIDAHIKRLSRYIRFIDRIVS